MSHFPPADPAGAAALVVAFLRLAMDGDRDGMIALAEENKGQPDLLAVAVVMLAAELTQMRYDSLSEAIRRFSKVT
jgi:hypothetical protein